MHCSTVNERNRIKADEGILFPWLVTEKGFRSDQADNGMLDEIEVGGHTKVVVKTARYRFIINYLGRDTLHYRSCSES